MDKKYARLLEERAVNEKTGDIWKITDVPRTWRTKTEARVIADGYTFDDDGTVIKVEE